MEIKNCAALISGGGSGLGAATAKLLSSMGAKIAILDINSSAAKQLATEINGLAIECDVTQETSVAHAVKSAADQQGAARICINCAGIAASKRMVGQQGPMPLPEFRKIIEVNLIGTFNLMRLAAANMIPLDLLGEERGVIINTASVAAFEGQIGQTAYSASKGGVAGLTLPAARELAQFGIRVMTIAPGLIDTPLFEKIPAEARAALASMVPFPKRLGYPSEYAELAVHIIKNTLLNGGIIRLDGALRMQPK
jgi:NAD(P)-dependent dehydrogenase (short-subunit alcohol dehydrogenase family)